MNGSPIDSAYSAITASAGASFCCTRASRNSRPTVLAKLRALSSWF